MTPDEALEVLLYPSTNKEGANRRHEAARILAKIIAKQPMLEAAQAVTEACDWQDILFHRMNLATEETFEKAQCALLGHNKKLKYLVSQWQAEQEKLNAALDATL